MVQVMVPPAPGAGFEQLKAGPAVCASETNVVPVGSVSVSDTLFAPPVPLFITVIV